MKKFLLIFCCALLLLPVLFVGCQKEKAPEAVEEAEKAETAAPVQKMFRIGYSCFGWEIPWMVYYKQLFDEEIAKLGNYEIIYHDAKYDFQVMADGLENFIAQDVDLIMHFALDNLPMLETYKKINEAGIPLLLTMDEPDYKAYDYMKAFSGLSPRDAGRQCALMLEETLKGKGKVALITAPKGSSSELQYTGGFMDQLRRMGSKLEVAAVQPGDWDVSVAQKAATDILTKYPKIDGFYVSDDWMGGGLVRALKEKGYKPGQVKIAAAGGSKIGVKDLQDGWYIGIVDQGPLLCMHQDIWMMRQILEFNVPVPHFAMVRQEIITLDNIDRFPGTW